MRELERSMAEKSVHRPPYKVTPSKHLRLSAGEKRRNYSDARGASNAVNAYPMPNRHEFF